ncbi:uncharacterized protein LOC132086202 [Ammospiza nelsoni]|uniref:uncharacterized protein LOC132086202 n=1 Tax=Ammospiza nelsoni TaxID=2857394 RepID=UPI002869ED5D|nr:uncharacterized protein LOC132086202 [Ammospiza nelsoni]
MCLIAFRMLSVIVLTLWLLISLGCGMQNDQLTTLHSRMKREVQTETQVIKVSNAVRAENVMIGLVKDFAKMQNTSRITACLPIPKAAGDPVNWGIITSKLPEIQKNKTITCKLVPESRQVTETSLVWQCEAKDRKDQIAPWDSAWSVSILQRFQYMANTPWCIKWEGPENETDPAITNTDTSSRTRADKVSWWACNKTYDCTSDDEEIEQMPPLAIALQIGCACRGIKHKQGRVNYKVIIGCTRMTIRGPGQFVWAASDGTWTTYLPVDGKVKEITLGLPTLCPIWKKSPFNGKHELLQIRARREVLDNENPDDTWQEPSSGVKFGWALESLFGPIANYKSREMLYKLTGQVGRLATVTREGFKELNIQFQATTKMTLQNRLALDMLLLKEHGVCGFLKEQVDHCCVHIPNVTADVEYDINQLKQIDHEAQEEQKDLATSWLGKIFKGLGWNVSSWIKSIIESVIILLIVFLAIWLVFSILKGEIQKKTSWNQRIIKALTRDPRPPSSGSPVRNSIHDNVYINPGFEEPSTI